MESMTQVQILDEGVYVYFRANALLKGMIPTLLALGSGLTVEQTGLSSIDKATSLREGELWIQISCTLLKIDIAPYSVGKRLG